MEPQSCNTAKVTLLDRLGFEAGRIEVPEPVPPVLIWGDVVYLASGDHFQEVKHYVVPDTSESGAHKLPEF